MMIVKLSALGGDRAFILLRSIFHFFIAGHEFSVTADFIPVFFMHHQHPETFAVMTVEMLVMHFVCPTDGTYITAVAAGKPFEALMNDDIMYQEISETVSHDAKADGLHPPHMTEGAGINEQDTWHSKNDKECIVLFKKAGFHLVMILVQVPEQPMHNKAMCKPGYSFHDQESKK